MEELEIVADIDGVILRCKGWCHDCTSESIYDSSVPNIDYFE